MRYLLILLLCSFLNPCFSQKKNSYVFLGMGVGSSQKTPHAASLGGRFSFGFQKELNNARLRIEPLLRYAHYTNNESSKYSNGKIDLYNIDINLHHDLVRVGYAAMIVGTGLGYQNATGHSGGVNSGNDTVKSTNSFTHSGVGINGFLGIRFRPVKTSIGMEIILYEMNYVLKPKTYEVGVLNVRLIYLF